MSNLMGTYTRNAPFELDMTLAGEFCTSCDCTYQFCYTSSRCENLFECKLLQIVYFASPLCGMNSCVTKWYLWPPWKRRVELMKKDMPIQLNVKCVVSLSPLFDDNPHKRFQKYVRLYNQS